jgi:hypothetical protein
VGERTSNPDINVKFSFNFREPLMGDSGTAPYGRVLLRPGLEEDLNQRNRLFVVNCLRVLVRPLVVSMREYVRSHQELDGVIHSSGTVLENSVNSYFL